MEFLGQIKEIDPQQWLALIDSHAALAHVPPRMGVNPFTREPAEYRAPRSTAQILVDGIHVGSVGWAMDGSPWLNVFANTESVEAVATIAEEVAATLNGRFVRSA